MEVGGQGVGLLLVVGKTAVGATAVNPLAELLVKNLLVRAAVAVKHDTRRRAHAAGLTLHEGCIGKRLLRRRTAGRALEPGLRSFPTGTRLSRSTPVLDSVVDCVG